MKHNDIILFLALFTLIVISTTYYPVFAVEYFSTFHDLNIDPETDLKKKKPKKTNLFNSISLSNIFKTSDPKPCDCEKKNECSKFKELDDNENMDYSKMLDKATYHSSCCPSTFSSSNGCACLTPEMKSFLNNRGNNKLNLI